MELNFIHLRSFYYLCLYGNRTDAVRKMRGYSIRLETFSRHLCQLEAETDRTSLSLACAYPVADPVRQRAVEKRPSCGDSHKHAAG